MKGTELEIACKYGNYANFERLLAQGVSISDWAILEKLSTDVIDPDDINYTANQIDIDEGKKKISQILWQIKGAPLIAKLLFGEKYTSDDSCPTYFDATRTFLLLDDPSRVKRTAIEYIFKNWEDLDWLGNKEDIVLKLLSLKAEVSAFLQETPKYHEFVAQNSSILKEALLAGKTQNDIALTHYLNRVTPDYNRSNDTGLGTTDLALLYHDELKQKNDNKTRDRTMRQHAYFCAGMQDLHILLTNIAAKQDIMFNNQSAPKDVLIGINQKGHTIAMYLKYKNDEWFVYIAEPLGANDASNAVDTYRQYIAIVRLAFSQKVPKIYLSRKKFQRTGRNGDSKSCYTISLKLLKTCAKIADRGHDLGRDIFSTPKSVVTRKSLNAIICDFDEFKILPKNILDDKRRNFKSRIKTDERKRKLDDISGMNFIKDSNIAYFDISYQGRGRLDICCRETKEDALQASSLLLNASEIPLFDNFTYSVGSEQYNLSATYALGRCKDTVSIELSPQPEKETDSIEIMEQILISYQEFLEHEQERGVGGVMPQRLAFAQLITEIKTELELSRQILAAHEASNSPQDISVNNINISSPDLSQEKLFIS